MHNETSLTIVKDGILAPAGLAEGDLEQTLGILMARSVDSADIYFQSSKHESWTLEDGIVKDGSFSQQQGVGVRAMSGDKQGFAYSDEILLPALTGAADAARAIAVRGQSGAVQPFANPVARPLYPATNPIDSLADQEKIDYLRTVDEAARALDPRVEQVIVSLSSSQEMCLVAASDGRSPETYGRWCA